MMITHWSLSMLSMTRKIIIINILIAFLILFNVLFLLKTIKQNNTIKQLAHQCKVYKESFKLLQKSVEYGTIMKTRNEGDSIKNLMLDSNNLKSHLILRLNTKSCQPCIQSILASLNKVDTVYSTNIVIIGSFNTKTEYKYYKQNLLNKFQVIDLGQEYLLDSPLEKKSIPYFFTIDENKRIRNLFIPDKNFMFLTDTYLKNILQCIN